MKKALALITVLGFFSIQSQAKVYSSNPEFKAGELIVKFRPGLKQNFFSQKKSNLELIKEIPLLNGEYALLKTSQKASMQTVLDQLNNDPNILYAEPNYIYKAIGNKLNMNDVLYTYYKTKRAGATNDPKFNQLWGLMNDGTNEPASNSGNSSPTGKAGADLNIAKAWGITKGDRRIKIAVIDTGVDYNHEDLKANMWTNASELGGKKGVDDDGNGFVDDIHGYDFANKDGDPMDGNGHGTHCSGTIAAVHNNNKGVAGVMAEAQIVGVKFLTDEGSGGLAEAIEAIDYATRIGVDIMSNSWGGGGYSQALKDAITRAHAAGIIFTAAAGNSASDNNSTPQYPASYDVPNVISVAAHNYNDQLASFSCFGSQTVHVAAPGRNILSTTPGNRYEVYSGTSMATPHVTGVVGLYLAEHGAQDPAELRDNLMKSSVYASAYGRTTIGGGRVDAYNFLKGIVTTRPAKPDHTAWKSHSVNVFESKHPYVEMEDIARTYRVPGARFLRVIVKKLDIEENYDTLSIIDKSGATVQRLHGKGTNVQSEYVDGDEVTVRFEADSSVNEWGFIIEEIQYIK